MTTAKNKKYKQTFGDRLAYIRKAKGMTQTELGDSIGVSKRIICYYEKTTKNPPASKLHLIANTLKVSTDELLGVKEIKDIEPLKNKKLLKRLKLIDTLPSQEQKALIHYIDLLLTKQKA